MKKLIFLLNFVLFFGNINAQLQVPFTCNFTDPAQNNVWQYIQHPATINRWHLNPTAIPGTPYPGIYVTNSSDGASNQYSSGTSTAWIYADVIFPESSQSFILNFRWRCRGEGDYGHMSAYIGPTTSANISPATLWQPDLHPTGATIINNNSGSANTGTRYYSDFNSYDDTWHTQTYTLPAADYQNTTKRIWFKWTNANMSNFNPPAAIREISITTPLVPITLTPAHTITNVALEAEVSVTFNQNITNNNNDLSRVTISPSPGTVSPAVDGSVLTIAHADFEYATRYIVTVPANSIAGYNQDIIWSFTTVNGTSPIEILFVTPDRNATNVALSAEVSATFNQPITQNNPSEITIMPNPGNVLKTSRLAV